MTDAPALTRLHPHGPLIHALIEAYNAHDPERVAAFYAEDFVGEDVAQAQPQHGAAELRRLMVYYYRAFPDLHIELQDAVFERDRVVMVWVMRGTQRGTFMRIPPTGRSVAVRGTTVLTLRDGLIRRALRVWDVAGLLRAIGLLPEL